MDLRRLMRNPPRGKITEGRSWLLRVVLFVVFPFEKYPENKKRPYAIKMRRGTVNFDGML